MRNFLFSFIIIFCSISIVTGQVSYWEETLEEKKGQVQINYYNSEHFISDASGDLVGMEYDLLESFFTFCENQYQVKIDRNYLKAQSFGDLYNYIKTGASSGEIASCSFSMTPKRMEEMQFSPKYMSDIEVLICSHNLPLVADTAQFIKVFKNTTAFTIANTTFDDDIKK